MNIEGGTWLVENCTIAANRSLGIGYDSSNNSIIADSILWDNGSKELAVGMSMVGGPATAFVIVSHCNVYQGLTQVDVCGFACELEWRDGNIDADPCFAEPGYWDPNETPDDPDDDFWIEGDYHLKSQAGRWDANKGRWTKDDMTSPCIDAGDPNSPIGYEPFPNGGIINMGAYGGSSQASKSYFGEPVCETIVAGDINGDCKVDFLDFAIMVSHWLEKR
jgi:hypothetical protein